MRYVDGHGPRTALLRPRGRAAPDARGARSSRRWPPRSTPRTRAALVHRDVKPANVLLAGARRARLPDRLRAHARGRVRDGRTTDSGQLGRHARLHGARADPRRAGRRARRRLRARLRALPRRSPASPRSSADATRRRCRPTSTSRRRGRRGAPGCPRARRGRSSARSRRTPPTATPRPATSAARSPRDRGRGTDGAGRHRRPGASADRRAGGRARRGGRADPAGRRHAAPRPPATRRRRR